MNGWLANLRDDEGIFDSCLLEECLEGISRQLLQMNTWRRTVP